MNFPTGFLDFKDADKRELSSLGVTEEQFKHLRLALPIVRAFADPNSYASSKDVSEILSDIEKLSGALSNKLISLTRRGNAARAAYAMIEAAYWSDPLYAGNAGPDVPNRIVPELRALNAAAKSASGNLPQRRGRTTTANPLPIKHIDDALRRGWTETHGSNVFSVYYKDGMEVKSYRNGPQREKYLPDFLPSKAINSGFRRISGVCYATVGGNADPIRAIENYLKQRRLLRRESMAALEKGIAEADLRANRMLATKRA